MHRITMNTTGPAAGPRWRVCAAAGLAVVVGVALSACGSNKGSGKSNNPLSSGASKGTVVVGSANFPEDELLAQIYASDLQAHGIKVTTKFNIGAREVYYPEIKKGTITIIPEYNGALLTTSVNTTSTAATTAQVDAALKAGLPSTLEILNPASAQDADSVTVTQATATKDHLTSIADLKPYASKMVFGGPPEFRTRTDGLVGLKKNYGLTFKNFVPTDESGPITITDLKNGKVQAADIFTTTPQIATNHFVTLTDPKNNFAAQNVIPLVYKAGVDSKIVGLLNAISAKLTTSALLQMDTALVVQHASYTQVAQGFLSTEGLM
ncbi:MAG TPA: glycine betaine ABC transporter substrate-binding protein [Streptosporangiaceae bacterium]|nr:glycine betaine ABC transporter substrate-binding protein [Streptosporangiaceae bacterium]